MDSVIHQDGQFNRLILLDPFDFFFILTRGGGLTCLFRRACFTNLASFRLAGFLLTITVFFPKENTTSNDKDEKNEVQQK